ncbi:polyphenol oxidase I, chloroplastic-like [Olea europaea var. sylvestris]|uniref:Polyphenol oxidase, chloroplastic-like n=1 Tax=Olea europaea subsp. europaea TaxID=158383 RepID=A0A8S0UBA7_OLEEU|nr:polyphenol oxidase I, chloroplastic-like [Olea europaea var. sylvestris]WDQ36036.1 chloroplast polyphenol oxidase 4 [Olea europaea]CAA3006931.1 polyphenol oxidase, chloroplastic-like [Olea europaea subsp. europaea]CAA3015103.1 polyphenol oxidase, chloroplastic-like [Olea europaea subsp. europaea]
MVGLLQPRQMTSFCAIASVANCIPYSSSFSSNKPSFFKHQRKDPVVKFTCRAKNDDQRPETTTKNGENSPEKLDRRDVLLGLGGLYTTSLAVNPMAISKPALPDFKDCIEATQPNGTPINCCPPPLVDEVTDYCPCATTVNIRKAAQSFTVDSDYYKKYSKAIQKMKNLALSDPRNFLQQANVHCAYCDGGYTQQGHPNLLYEIHNSWLFFPWHRWFVYFFEKICQNLIDDDTFALPFWNWDAPAGMQIPPIYNSGVTSPLYDTLRNPKHLPPSVVNLEWFNDDATVEPEVQIKYNLAIMYRQMITQSKTQIDFFGNPIRDGDDVPKISASGTIEITPHNHMHSWTGTSVDPNNPINMGVFYSAARDPIFSAHHTNIDRLWTIWLNQLKGTNITDPDWLNAYFIFYNEEAKPVRVRIQDGLDITRLGYAYEEVPIPWLDASAKPKSRTKAKTLPSAPDPAQVFPTTLDKPINVIVKRPKKSGSGSSEEILVIEGVEYDKRSYVDFNVYINEDDVNACRPDNAEFLGSFSNLPHGHQMSVKTDRQFRISEVLEELGAQDYDRVLVTLVPKSNPVKINGIKIKFDP